MRIDILTLFPEMFVSLNASIFGRAIEKGKITLNVIDIREFSTDKHKKCDDYPFGGGAGMLMTPQPLHDAIIATDPNHEALRIYMSPRGKVLKHDVVLDIAKNERLLIVCGHYEGIDERIIELDIDMELSIGDYVLTGGELAAMVVADAVSRYVDGVLGSDESTEIESFTNGLLEYPQYTRPQEFMGLKVPDVLLSGNHQAVDEWRMTKQLEVTLKNRPELVTDEIRTKFEPKKKNNSKKL